MAINHLWLHPGYVSLGSVHLHTEHLLPSDALQKPRGPHRATQQGFPGELAFGRCLLGNLKGFFWVYGDFGYVVNV